MHIPLERLEASVVHPFNLTISLEPAATAIGVSGEIDMCCAPQLLDAIVAAHESYGHDVVVDLGGVTFMDSQGLSALVSAQQRLQERGAQVRVVNVGPRVAQLIHITGLAAHLGVAEPDDLAVESS